jgi:hypothetical protein
LLAQVLRGSGLKKFMMIGASASIALGATRSESAMLELAYGTGISLLAIAAISLVLTGRLSQGPERERTQ